MNTRTFSRDLVCAAGALALVAAAFVAGCGGDKKPTGKPATSVDGLIAQLKSAGLQTGDFAPAEVGPLAPGKCERGDVSGVEVTVCAYADAGKAKQAESAGLALVGDNTGASLAQGALLLVVADRKGVDKDGKKIDQITRALRGQ
jgi:hypothetical protein